MSWKGVLISWNLISFGRHLLLLLRRLFIYWRGSHCSGKGALPHFSRTVKKVSGELGHPGQLFLRDGFRDRKDLFWQFLLAKWREWALSRIFHIIKNQNQTNAKITGHGNSPFVSLIFMMGFSNTFPPRLICSINCGGAVSLDIYQGNKRERFLLFLSLRVSGAITGWLVGIERVLSRTFSPPFLPFSLTWWWSGAPCFHEWKNGMSHSSALSSSFIPNEQMPLTADAVI